MTNTLMLEQALEPLTIEQLPTGRIGLSPYRTPEEVASPVGCWAITEFVPKDGTPGYSVITKPPECVALPIWCKPGMSREELMTFFERVSG